MLSFLHISIVTLLHLCPTRLWTQSVISLTGWDCREQVSQQTLLCISESRGDRSTPRARGPRLRGLSSSWAICAALLPWSRLMLSWSCTCMPNWTDSHPQGWREAVLMLSCNLLWLALAVCSITTETKRDTGDLYSTCACSRHDLSKLVYHLHPAHSLPYKYPGNQVELEGK